VRLDDEVRNHRQQLQFAYRFAESVQQILAGMTVAHLVQALWLIGLTVAMVLK
jgi:hypothetical protein